MKKRLIMVASVGVLAGSGYAEVLFSSNFDGHNVAVDPSYVKDSTGVTNAAVSWSASSSVTAISDLTAITGGGGFINQNTSFSSGDNLKVNYNLNNGIDQGIRFNFTLNETNNLDQLTVIAAHANGTGVGQAYSSDLTYTLSGGTLSGDVTGSSNITYALAFQTINFDLTGTTLGAGTYTLQVDMSNLSEGGAYATYDGITLETVSAPSAFAIGTAPSGGFITNGAGASVSNTRVASGNTKGQSFTLAGNADLAGFAFEVNSVTTVSDFSVEIYAASGHLPTGDALFSYTGTLPAGLTAGDWLEFTFGSTLGLAAGDYALLLNTSASDLRFELNASDGYAGGQLIRNNSSSGWEVGNASDDFIFSLFGTMVDPNARTPASGPNIIFLLSDDQGWTDHSVTNAACGYQSDYIQTPNMERLASEGVSFTSAYAQPNCAPSRAALYSGQYSCRTGNGVYNVWSLNRAGSGRTTYTNPADQHDEWIDESGNAIPIAKALYDGGYVTAHFGKFHVGSSSAAPTIQGYEYNYGGNEHGSPKGSFHAVGGQFDEFIGPELDAFAADYTGEYVTNNLLPVANGNDPTTLIGTPKHLSDAMGDAFISFMNSHRAGAMSNFPVYVQFNFYAPHTPIDPRSDLKAKYQALPSGTHHNKADYAGLVEGMDQNLGRILNYLDDPNGDGDFSDSMVTNTLVIFASDNGGRSGFTSNYPLRGHKGNHYQGGLRVPMMVRMPGTVPTNQVTDTMIHFVDLYPTMLDAASIAYPSPMQHALDGESFWNHTLDPDHVVRDRSPMFYHFPGYMDNRTYNCSAVIAEINHTRYKYIYAYDPYYNTGSGETYGFDQYQLYNLTDDVSETINLLDYIDVENAGGPNDPSSSREYWDYMLNKDVGEQLAGMLSSWLVGAPGDTSWNPIYTTYKSNYPNLDPGLVGTETGPAPAALPELVIPPEQVFRIQESFLQNSNHLGFVFNSEPGYLFWLQSSTNLVSGIWEDASASVISSGDMAQLNVPVDAFESRYFRIRVAQP